MSNSSHHNPAALRELHSLGASWVICSSWGFIISGAGEVIYTDNCGTERERDWGLGLVKRDRERLDLNNLNWRMRLQKTSSIILIPQVVNKLPGILLFPFTSKHPLGRMIEAV